MSHGWVYSEELFSEKLCIWEYCLPTVAFSKVFNCLFVSHTLSTVYGFPKFTSKLLGVKQKYLILGQVFVAEREIKNVLVEGVGKVDIDCISM